MLTLDQACRLLSKKDVLQPNPKHYWLEANYLHYTRTHHAVGLYTPRKIIAERYPVYLAAFDQSMKRAIGHQFNMFIMKWDLAERCCQWLFDKLFELER